VEPNAAPAHTEEKEKEKKYSLLTATLNED
jgi:hypothetical protein